MVVCQLQKAGQAAHMHENMAPKAGPWTLPPATRSHHAVPCSAYRTPNELATFPGAGGAQLVARTSGNGTRLLTLSDPSGTGASCSATLAMQSADAGCPEGTSPASNPQLSNASDPAGAAARVVFKQRQCEPCATGHRCLAGMSVECEAGTFTDIVGDATDGPCFACPSGTASRPGESGRAGQGATNSFGCHRYSCHDAACCL